MNKMLIQKQFGAYQLPVNKDKWVRFVTCALCNLRAIVAALFALIAILMRRERSDFDAMKSGQFGASIEHQTSFFMFTSHVRFYWQGTWFYYRSLMAGNHCKIASKIAGSLYGILTIAVEFASKSFKIVRKLGIRKPGKGWNL